MTPSSFESFEPPNDHTDEDLAAMLPPRAHIARTHRAWRATCDRQDCPWTATAPDVQTAYEHTAAHLETHQDT